MSIENVKTFGKLSRKKPLDAPKVSLTQRWHKHAAALRRKRDNKEVSCKLILLGLVRDARKTRVHSKTATC